MGDPTDYSPNGSSLVDEFRLLKNLSSENVTLQDTFDILCRSRRPNFTRPSLCDLEQASGDSEAFEIDDLKPIVAIVVPILFGIIVIVGLIGNFLVVVVVAFNQQMRSTTNILIFNLALADLLFIIFCVPFTATDYALPSWPFGAVWCKIVQYLVIVTAYASVYTLVFMSIDRYLAVVHPIASMAIRNERNAYRAILLLWALISLACLPAMPSHGLQQSIHPDDTSVSYVCSFLKEDWNWPGFQISFFVTSYAIPLGTICCLYLIMLRKLWFGVGPAGHTSSESVRGKRRVTRLVTIVVAVFAVCWCPIQVILVLKSLEAYTMDTARVTVQIVSHVLAYMNSCVNPILYAFLSDNFRKAFLKLIYCGNARRMSNRFSRNAGNATQNGRDANAMELDRTNTTRVLRKNSSPNVGGGGVAPPDATPEPTPAAAAASAAGATTAPLTVTYNATDVIVEFGEKA
ncbi:unnamed protein product [Notodromas monacha]|uniref:G-protein coupled receptors family 1 profile domain-containing protein n=1 Tax=Notodromas monacha TaxID=399045 RepID=A0A7R9BNB4_9CRUS|nr:unnamed protein product [Notodromas monacha]CAG0918674.1 unnamed protein product [Notodromas monacha]